jgi:hypothetical protein
MPGTIAGAPAIVASRMSFCAPADAKLNTPLTYLNWSRLSRLLVALEVT